MDNIRYFFRGVDFRLRSQGNDIVPLSYRYRTGLIFGSEKLTVHMGPVRYGTSFGTCSHGYAIVPFRRISRQNKHNKI